MVRYRRNRVAGGTYFLTVTLRDRRSTLLTDHVQLLRNAFRYVWQSRPFTLDAVVILPEHLHLLMSLPADDADYSGRILAIKTRFTRNLRGSAAAASGLSFSRSPWQTRFWEHTIRDEDDLRRHVDYIHYNPVKHGVVQRVVDWPWSSFHRYVKQGILPEDWGGGGAMDDEGTFGE